MARTFRQSVAHSVDCSEFVLPFFSSAIVLIVHVCINVVQYDHDASEMMANHMYYVFNILCVTNIEMWARLFVYSNSG